MCIFDKKPKRWIGGGDDVNVFVFTVWLIIHAIIHTHVLMPKNTAIMCTMHVSLYSIKIFKQIE